MNEKEAKRVYVMEQVLAGKITVRQAAELLDLSERQVFRLKGGMKNEGVAALAHKNRGRKPKHAVPQEVRELIISLALGLFRDAFASIWPNCWPGFRVFLCALRLLPVFSPRLVFLIPILIRLPVEGAPAIVCLKRGCWSRWMPALLPGSRIGALK
ncbi:helix-turn-helix domain-containing protein [Neomoorella mulderi]|uniref:Uncharacterized protein n=1 Tax=Moorella mulderi DSM 14980 TaxID=1122241 RepID=A0A151AUI9_9FIRM|nr:helix-turn-helix domain-containing protein [Moorella mulderi]KYH31067.1 hypothetical protein MOMUL_25980 [Moorella mulderi DSM 14980]